MLVREMVDYGIIFFGFSEFFLGVNNSDIDIFIVCIDIDGIVFWIKVYDEGFIEWLVDVVELEDGFLILGMICFIIILDDKLYLFNIDRRGNKRWSKIFEFDIDDLGVVIVFFIDGNGYLIIGIVFDKDNG